MSRCLSSGRWIMVVVFLAAATSLSLAEGTVMIDLPRRGELGRVAEEAVQKGTRQGFSVAWYDGEEDPTGPEVWALVCMSDSSLRNSRAEALGEFVAGGGGLVYLLRSNEKQISRDSDFLKRFDIRLRNRDAQPKRLRTGRHEITEDVNRLGDAPIPIHMYGRDQTVLMRQSSRTVALACPFGEGRIAVLPVEALSRSGKDSRRGDRVRLLAGAISWAAQARQKTADKAGTYPEDPQRQHYEEKEAYKHRREPLEKLPQPEDFEGDTIEAVSDEAERTSPELPSGQTQLAETCLVDGGGEKDGWPQVWQLLQQVLPEAGLQIERVPQPPEDKQREEDDYQQGGPFMRVLPREPSLMVVYSWRKYSWEEARAVADHVRAGGALLALASVEPERQSRMRYFNRILQEFGVAASLTRPAGSGHFAEAALTENVQVAEIPSGIGIWSFDDIELVRAGDTTVASVLTSGEGRVFVMDAKTLWADEEAVRSEFTELLKSAVNWLIGAD